MFKQKGLEAVLLLTVGAGIYLTGYSILKMMSIGLYDTLGETLFLGVLFTTVGLILNELTPKETLDE